MKARQICHGVQWMGVVDWNRRLFDSLVPLPDGTSYNAYLVKGAEKTALLDTVDPAMEGVLMRQLASVDRIDYMISHHVEQDHSGTIPAVLEKYSQAIVVCTPKAKELLVDHLDIAPERVKTVADGESISLGGKTLRFVYTPWVHWPETMVTHLVEDRILFTCDFFGSHLATTDLFAGKEPYVCEAAKRYYAEIMMPFRKAIQGNLEKVRGMRFDFIAPSHGPIYDQPDCILSAYEDWVSDRVSNLVVIPYISMHGSTEMMVDYLVAALAERGIKVQKFELSSTDIGKLAMALVDAATIVIGTPTVHVGPHPSVFSATHLANALRPKLKYAAIIGSYGWGDQGRGTDFRPDPQSQGGCSWHGDVQGTPAGGKLRRVGGPGRQDQGEARGSVRAMLQEERMMKASQTEQTIDTSGRTIGAIVADDYRTAEVFEKYGLDFCCGGKVVLATACKGKGIELAALTRELDAVRSEPVERSQNYASWELPFLADYIVNAHHAYIKENSGRISVHAHKIATVHGANHPEVIEIATVFERIATDMAAHLREEEEGFFPAVKRAYANKKTGLSAEAKDIETIKASVKKLSHEHKKIGDAVHKIRHLAKGYAIPDDVCNTFVVTYRELKEFEDDLHKHVHLENNILFPKAAQL